MKKLQTAEELKLENSFDSLKAILTQPQFQERWEYPLAYWTLASDRRLPMALLNHSLGKVLQTSFHDLALTPGIGLKKLASLILLLQRASTDAPPSVPITVSPVEVAKPAVAEEFRPVDENGRFNPDLVSEALWQLWRETAVLHELDDEKLGRLAPSLLELPTVIWDRRLSTYVGQSLQSIRQLRTHGEKRVRVVLEVFFVIHEMLKNTGRHPRYAVRLAPSFVPPLERWFDDVLNRESLPSLDEIKNDLVQPLVDQLDLDVGAEVVQLVRGRLGVGRLPTTVRQQSRDLGVTRARIYQLLEECHSVMNIRWPEGRRLFQELHARLEQDSADPEVREFFTTVYDLFFPRKYQRVELVLQQA